jgi:hypothetical protein
MRFLDRTRCRQKGQATTELAIMGSIIVMLMAYLLQQGFVYNARQGLEMYTFREALRKSKQEKRGVTLTVVRDVIAPSFFTGITRQRLMATSSAEMAPYDYYDAANANDVSSKQFIQIGEPMIRRGNFIQAPAIKVKITTAEKTEDQYVSAPISELDSQSMSSRSSTYSYVTNATESVMLGKRKRINKDLVSNDDMNIGVKFEKAEDIESSYVDNEWRTSGDERIVSADVVGTPPGNTTFRYQETVRRQRTTTTDF